MALQRADAMQALDQAIAGAGPPPAAGGDGTVLCKACGTVIDSVTGEPVGPVGGSPAGPGPAGPGPRPLPV